MRFTKYLKFVLIGWLLGQMNLASAASVVLYHHVSEKTPKSTSVSPQQFADHLALIDELGLTVVPLTKITDAIKQKQPVDINWIAITFDDGYRSVYEYAFPMLKKRGWPFTIFVNPDMVKPSKLYMDWQQLNEVAQFGATIANHTLKHENLIKDELSIEAIKQNLLSAEQKILERTGQSHKMLAYPFGEYDQDVKQLLKQLGFIGFAQHSGAINETSDILALTRFPANGIYANVKTLKNKLNSIPFHIKDISPSDTKPTEKTPALTVSLTEKDFYNSQLACFISGFSQPQKPTWNDKMTFTVKAPEAIGTGRVKYNCTAPSKKHRGRFYWMSKLWIN